MERQTLSFVHKFIPSTGTDKTTLLVLHGTGGDENDLLPLAREVSPSASLLSPRGKVLEDAMARFFRRFPDGTFDSEDLKLRTDELAKFVKSASQVYGFDPSKVVAFGFSNGANMAASLLLLHPEALAGAIMLRAMIPLIPEKLPRLDGKQVLVIGGRRDELIAPSRTERLRDLLDRAGAKAELRWVQGGHALGEEDVTLSRRWLKEHYDKTAD